MARLYVPFSRENQLSTNLAHTNTHPHLQTHAMYKYTRYLITGKYINEVSG